MAKRVKKADMVGGYFASMGLFAFGCAAGNCGVGRYSEGQKNQGAGDFEEVVFEEVKGKERDFLKIRLIQG
jgi:hypothetical protein